MQQTSPILIIALFVCQGYGIPINKDTDRDLVKRQAIEFNSDNNLKQISLQRFIDDLEASLFKTAISVGGVIHNSDIIIPEVTKSLGVHNIAKRKSELSTTMGTTPQTEQIIESTTNSINPKVLLQTTARIPKTDNLPAHILIDRIAVQSHYGGLPLIPTFDLQSRKKVTTISTTTSTTTARPTDILSGITSSTEKVPEMIVSNKLEQNPTTTTATTATIIDINSSVEPTTKKNEDITATVTEDHSLSTKLNSISSSTASTDSSSTSSTTTTTTTSTSSTTTTARPAEEKVKNIEEELLEKVAEIEAEPIILSARV